jgi:hypothetical protein
METSSAGKRFLLALLVLAVWIMALNWLFHHFLKQSYLDWYLKNGTLISTATAFLALIWGKLEQEQRGLLSWNPLQFMATCLVLVGIFYQALGASLRNPAARENHRPADLLAAIQYAWDGFCSILMSLLMAFAVIGWLLVIAPLFYLLTLVTGAPARREISGTGRRLIYRRYGSQVSIDEQPASDPIPNDAVDISLGKQPFAFTNAINAAVLFLASRVIPHWQ